MAHDGVEPISQKNNSISRPARTGPSTTRANTLQCRTPVKDNHSMRRRQHNPHKKKRRRAAADTPIAANSLQEAINFYNEGVTHQQHNNLPLAEAAFRKAISIRHDFGEALNNLGNVLKEQGKWKAAEKSYRQALRVFPDNAMLRSNIGNVLYHQGKFQEAARILEDALQQDPRYAYAYNNLGNVCMALGKYDEAIKNFQQARDLLPDAADIANNLGAALCKQARNEEAVSLLHETIKQHPRFIEAYLNLADAALKLGATNDAIKVLQEAANIGPDKDAVHGKLAEAYYMKADYLATREAVSMALKINPQNADYYCLLGRTLSKMNMFVDAESMLRRAISMQPDNASFYNALGINFGEKGDIQQSIKSFQQAVKHDPLYVSAHSNLALLVKHDRKDESIHVMEKLLETGNLQNEEIIMLHNSLGKSYDDFSDYESAFKHISTGNILRTEISPYNINELKDSIHETLDVFTNDYINRHKDIGHHGCTPIFIVGMPRSGKTVIENVLCRHPLITAGGESTDFIQACNEILEKKTGQVYPGGCRIADSEAIRETGFEYSRRLKERFSDASIVTNTLPGNTQYLGMIHMSLPDSKIILCRRGAKDHCMEMFRSKFARGHLYSFDPDVLPEYFILQTEFMDEWLKLLPGFIHIVQFENLVRDPENETRALIDFCGLPWDDICLNTDSVPKPGDVIDVWHHYQPYLQPMYDRLDSYSKTNN
jgi:tetratricopeptide (TPR) repeat protein